MVPQVRIIGILMIVNGVLCILYGFVLMAMGPFMQSVFAMQGAQAPPQQQAQIQQMQQMMKIFVWVYAALGIANAAGGIVNIAAGIPAMRYRRRTFVIVGLLANVATFASCYCLPTSLGLMIWGLIVMFQKETAEAFRMGDAGRSVDEIKSRFADDDRRRGDYDDDRRSGRDEDDPPPGNPPRGTGQGDGGIRKL
jgi:MFS family permease